MNQVTLQGTDPVRQWYEDRQVEYAMTDKRLTDTRAKFISADFHESLDMLEKSYVNAVISQQNTVEIYEPAFRQWAIEGESPYRAFESVNYGRQKIGWISDGLDNTKAFRRGVDLLKKRQVHDFVRLFAEEVKGVSHMKASFTAAMLGFTEAMCLDTNVCQSVGLDRRAAVDLSNYQEYRELCDQVTDMFEDLQLSPFMLQWVLFDFNKGYHSPHKVWFEAMGSWQELDRTVVP